MERREQNRWFRRLSVRFWQRGENGFRTGHTLNLSVGGMFLGTHRPLKSGSRVRLEIEGEEGFIAEGVVTHSRQVAPELRRIKEPGMGIRFLSTDELVEPLRQSAGAQAAARSAQRGHANPLDGTESQGEALTVPVRFASADSFLTALQRDVALGGMFVPTRRPAPLSSRVQLQLEVPGYDGPIPLPARVVQRFDPTEHGEKGGRTPGMGVELLDPSGAYRLLTAVARKLGRSLEG